MTEVEREICDEVCAMKKANISPSLLIVNWNTYAHLRANSLMVRFSQGSAQEEYYGDLVLRCKPNLNCSFLVM